MKINKKNSALVLVDLQNDFCPGGSLAVPEGDAVIAVANEWQPLFDLVVATKDWHPQKHMSFASNHPGKKIGESVQIHQINQILWPDHCVQHSFGAEFRAGLNVSSVQKIFHKGIDPAVDSYSAFFDNEHLRSTGLGDYLRERGMTTIYVMGLATDYCVKYSCLDAVKLGFEVYAIKSGCRGVELQRGDTEKAWQEMQEAGVKLISDRSW